MSENVPVWVINRVGKKCIRITDYLHSSKEDNWEKASEIGMDQNEEFMRHFRYTLYEVKFELEVYEDGTSKIIKVDGHELK